MTTPGEPVPVPKVAETPERDYLDQLIWLKAEFENFRKRADREKSEYYRLGQADLLLKLLPIYDLLQQAHRDIATAHTNTALAQGMEGIFKEFEKIFKEEGVTAMEPLGKPYDPLTQEVLGTVESEQPEGLVVEVLQNGFRLQDKVLRIAKVRIAKRRES